MKRKNTVIVIAFAVILGLLIVGDGINDFDSRNRSAAQGDRIDANEDTIRELIEEVRLLREAIEQINLVNDATENSD